MKEKRSYVMTARAAGAEETKARIRRYAAQVYLEGTAEEFTLEAVARLADVSIRTVLRAYPSKEELLDAALVDLSEGLVFMKPTAPGNVPITVAAKFDIYESMGELVMRMLEDEQRRPALKPMVDRGRKIHRDEMKVAFAPQLERVHGAARKELLTMLVMLTDIYIWKLLRRDMGYSRPAAEAVVCKMIAGAIKEVNGDGKDTVVELVGRRKSSASTIYFRSPRSV